MFFLPFNTLMLLCLLLSQIKTSFVVFLWKRRTSSVVFLAKILYLMAWYRPNMGQKSIKVLMFPLNNSICLKKLLSLDIQQTVLRMLCSAIDNLNYFIFFWYKKNIYKKGKKSPFCLENKSNLFLNFRHKSIFLELRNRN